MGLVDFPKSSGSGTSYCDNTSRHPFAEYEKTVEIAKRLKSSVVEFAPLNKLFISY